MAVRCTGRPPTECYDTRDCIIQFDLLTMSTWCSKHVEAWNKLIIKFSASSWLILINKKFPRCPTTLDSAKLLTVKRSALSTAVTHRSTIHCAVNLHRRCHVRHIATQLHYSRITSTKSPSLCMTILSPSFTKLSPPTPVTRYWLHHSYCTNTLIYAHTFGAVSRLVTLTLWRLTTYIWVIPHR